MKTNKHNKTNNKTLGSRTPVSELQNRTEQLSETATAKTPETETATGARPEGPPPAPAAAEAAQHERRSGTDSMKLYVNFAERDANRQLSVDKVLEKLRRWMPTQYALAEVVGKWVWITFPEPPLERVRADLSQLGFHWNNTRKCWQHPCGETLPRGQQEPRDKYEVWFPMASAARTATAALRQKQGQALEQAAA